MFAKEGKICTIESRGGTDVGFFTSADADVTQMLDILHPRIQMRMRSLFFTSADADTDANADGEFNIEVI